MSQYLSSSLVSIASSLHGAGTYATLCPFCAAGDVAARSGRTYFLDCGVAGAASAATYFLCAPYAVAAAGAAAVFWAGTRAAVRDRYGVAEHASFAEDVVRLSVCYPCHLAQVRCLCRSWSFGSGCWLVRRRCTFTAWDPHHVHAVACLWPCCARLRGKFGHETVVGFFFGGEGNRVCLVGAWGAMFEQQPEGMVGRAGFFVVVPMLVFPTRTVHCVID